VKEAIDYIDDNVTMILRENDHGKVSWNYKTFIDALEEIKSLLQSQLADDGKTITCHTDGCEAEHPVGTVKCKWCGTKLKWPNTKENEGGEV
jgi:hypothetical protein